MSVITDPVLIQRKVGLRNIRVKHSTRSVTGVSNFRVFERLVRWNNKESSFLRRGLLPFGGISRNGNDHLYTGASIIREHLDDLVISINPFEDIDSSNLTPTFILDMGCGDAIVLEDIFTIYTGRLNLRLEGDTLHEVDYFDIFRDKGINIKNGSPGCKSSVRRNMFSEDEKLYDLIMVNRVACYYADPFSFVSFSQERLTNNGIFVADFNDFNTGTTLLDKSGKEIGGKNALKSYLISRGVTIGQDPLNPKGQEYMLIDQNTLGLGLTLASYNGGRVYILE